MLSDAPRRAVIVTSGDPETLVEMARASREALESGSAVRVFFRDESIPAICRDPKDDYLLAHALIGSADYLISRDKDLLTLREVEGIKIVEPAEFLQDTALS